MLPIHLVLDQQKMQKDRKALIFEEGNCRWPVGMVCILTMHGATMASPLPYYNASVVQQLVQPY